MTAAPLLVGCAFHDGADIDACGCPALDSPGAIAYRGLLVKARAEIARLAAELARVTECYSESHAAVDAGREIDRQNVAEVNRLAAELAAARAVPADVEAAMRHYGEVNSSPCWTAKGHADAEDALRTAIARAISDARRESADRARRDAARAAEACAADGKALGYSADYLAGVERVAVRLRAMEHNGGPLTSTVDSDATDARGTVGGLLAAAPVARPLSEWHEDHGDVLWWRFPIDEPPYCGSPLDDNWPDYHTHWTPIVCPDDPSQRGPLPKGG